MKRFLNFDSYNLPESFINDLKKIYSIDENAIICGSTALFLYGKLNRFPNDIDVISSQSDKIRESFLPLETMNEEANAEDRIAQIEKVAKSSDDFYDFMSSVKYILGVKDDNNLSDDNYDTVSEIWKYIRRAQKKPYYKNDEGFTFKFSAKGENKICVFHPHKEVDHNVIKFKGMNLKLESLDLVLKYKKMYSREKDIQDMKDMNENETPKDFLEIFQEIEDKAQGKNYQEFDFAKEYADKINDEDYILDLIKAARGANYHHMADGFEASLKDLKNEVRESMNEGRKKEKEASIFKRRILDFKAFSAGKETVQKEKLKPVKESQIFEEMEDLKMGSVYKIYDKTNNGKLWHGAARLEKVDAKGFTFTLANLPKVEPFTISSKDAKDKYSFTEISWKDDYKKKK